MTEVKKRLAVGLVYDDEGFRMSTPIQIAEYKAERLKTESIADLGAGIGIQALSFALESTRVYAVDNNKGRVEYGRKNAEILGLTNIEFTVGDVFDGSIVKRTNDFDAIHSDPSRSRTSERWSFEDLSPDPNKIMDLYRPERASFDLPAFMPSSAIPADWEIEYVSIEGELKRMCTYSGAGMSFGKSAITLPSRERVVANRDSSREVEVVDRPSKWIYDLDGSLFYSDLLPEFIREREKLSLLYKDRQKTLLTSEKFYASHFLTKTYSVLQTADTVQDLKEKLFKMGAGRVVIRYSIDPSQYYENRRNLGKDLDGDGTAYVFKFNDKYFLAERVDKDDEKDED